MVHYLFVSIGAAAGGIFRYWISNYVHKFFPANFPYGTLTVNLVGSFLVGFIMYYLNEREIISANMRILLAVGFCDGFTTFSTFSLETMNLIRDSELLLAGLNVILNISLCLTGIFLAYIIFKAN
jgi:CrcB protein